MWLVKFMPGSTLLWFHGLKNKSNTHHYIIFFNSTLLLYSSVHSDLNTVLDTKLSPLKAQYAQYQRSIRRVFVSGINAP